ncbi:exocyst subunit [Coemansia sp. Cherry 401B]|nr:exocyst subunit [Coemansia sp. RSA 2705]KAJ2317755.1 exocyst subunit [Coemansia sp. RSA 2704]KAJ2732604.1 exocyst subunit [Coemansia sp. Cherry 401B]
MRDLFHMERGDVGGVDALYAPVAARFADLAAGAPDRRRVLTAPAVIDEYADVQNSLQHKLLAAPDVEHAPALLGMALAFTRRVAPMLAAAGVSVSGASGAGASLSPAVRRSVGAELSPPPHDSAADEYLHAFFANAFLPHAEAQAARAFDALTGASDAFDADPDARLGGRPVFRSAAALVPQLARLGALLSRLGAFGGGGGDGWAALLQLAARYYERCLALFRDTVRSPEGQTYLSVRWSESLDMMQLFDRRMRNDGDALREIRAEEALKADRSLNPYELVFDGKRLAAVAQLHQTLEWLRAQLAPVLAGAADCARVLGRFQSLAVQCLMVLRIEVRVHCMHYLDLALREGDYALARDAVEPEPYVQALNADLAAAEERLAACLPADKLALVFAGVSVLMAHTLVANARHIRRFNAAGCRKMARNILALQQNLTNIALPEEGGLDAARRYYELYDLGADGILRHIAEHGAEFALDDYRRMLAFVCSGSADAAAPSPGRASSLLEASQADQYEAHVLRLRELLAAPPIPARK